MKKYHRLLKANVSLKSFLHKVLCFFHYCLTKMLMYDCLYMVNKQLSLRKACVFQEQIMACFWRKKMNEVDGWNPQDRSIFIHLTVG